MRFSRSVSKSDIFISHSPQDAISASIIADALEGDGLRCSLHDTANPFMDLSDLHSSIPESGQILLLLSTANSPSQPSSGWDLASAFSPRRIIPIRLDNIDVAQIIGSRVCIDLSDVPTRYWIEHLREALSPPQYMGLVSFPGHQPAARRNLPAVLPKYGNRFVWNAPIRKTPGFFGRDDLLQRLEHNVMPVTPRSPVSVSVIIGGQGLGKSSLALEFAHRNRDKFEVVWWCRADDNASMLSDLRGLARSLRLTHDSTDAIGAARAARSWCENAPGRWLLIFDNANDPDSVVPWIPLTGNGVALITSRVNAWGSFSHYLAVDRLDIHTSVKLLLETTAWNDEAAAIKLARQVGCLPVAIELLSVLGTSGRLSLKELQKTVQVAADEALSNSNVFEPEQVESTVLDSIIDVCIKSAVSERREIRPFLPILGLLGESELPVSLLRRGYKSTASDDLIRVLVKYGIVRLTDSSTLSIHPAVYSRITALTAMQDSNALSEATSILLRHIQHAPTNQPGSIQDMLMTKAARLVQITEDANVVSRDSVYLCDEIVQHYMTLGEVDRTLDWLSRAVKLAASAGLNSDQISVKLRSQLASMLAHTGRLPEALVELGNTVGLQSARWDLDNLRWDSLDLGNLVANSNLALTLAEMGQLDLAKSLQEHLLLDCERKYGHHDPRVLTLKNNLASSLWELGYLERARTLYKVVLDVRRKLYGETHPETLVCIVNLASVIHEMGDLEQAKAYYEVAISNYRQSLGSDHPGVLACVNNYALLEADLGQLDTAEELYEDLVVRCRRVLGPEHPDTLAAINNLALVLARNGDIARAREFHEQVLRSRTRVLGNKHPDTLSSMANLCELLSMQGDMAGAYALGKRIVRFYAAVLGDRHPDSLIAMQNLAHILDKLGKADELRLLQQRINRARGAIA
jgi:tetratricopeptide (TPR) repeat protein